VRKLAHPLGPTSRDTGTAPRWLASEEPSYVIYVYRGVTIEDTGFDPDKGYEITEPDDRGRMLALIFLVALLISLVVELSDRAGVETTAGACGGTVARKTR
jgi:hypothetical protein